MVICLEQGADLHMAHLMPLSLALVKSWLALPFWYRLTWVVLEKGPLNGCVCVCAWLKTTCCLSVSAAPVATLPPTTVAMPAIESIQQRLLVQLAQSSTQPRAAAVPRPAISVIQLRPGTTAAPPTTLALPSPLAIRGGQPLTLVAAPPTTSAVRLNQVLLLYRSGFELCVFLLVAR